MRVRSSLHDNLSGESKAYGYTLCIWGSGTVLIAAFDIPTVWEVLALALGAVIGFAILALLAYGSVFREIQISYTVNDRLMAASMLHFVSSLGTIALSAVIAQFVQDPLWAFLLVGVNASVAYNIGLLVEVFLYQHLRQLEQRLHRHERYQQG